MINRVFLIVLDSVGIGALPDAEKFGDYGANTLFSVSKSDKFSIPNLINLGIGNIDGVDFLPLVKTSNFAFGRCAEASLGKDTTIGHWEIAGVITDKPFPTYPNGFPKEIIELFKKKTGLGVLCNKPYSGTEVIKDYGEKHLQTGDLIVYTSADSVFQIAAHEQKVPPEKLYEYCRIAREILTGEHAVARVIARPFDGVYPFSRTSRRRDFSLLPPDNLLDSIKQAGLEVKAVGKINDIFCSKGITEAIKTSNNADGIKKTVELINKDFKGLVFTNLVDFDMVYGHRNDIDGYAEALSRFDDSLDEILPKLREDDLIIITADHGCDPGDKSTDHTREYTPLLVYGKKVKPKNLGTRNTFADIGATIADILDLPLKTNGKSFLKEIIND